MTTRTWWPEVVEGIVSATAGIFAIAFPAFAAEILILLIAVWAIVVGVFQVYLAIRLRDEMQGEFWLGLAGVALILLGIGMLLFPAAAALSLVWLIGSSGDWLRGLPRHPRLAAAPRQQARQAGRCHGLQPARVISF